MRACVRACARVCVCVCVCVCVYEISSLKLLGQLKPKIHLEPPWDGGIEFIQLVQVICYSSLILSTSRGAGAGRWGWLLAGFNHEYVPAVQGV